mgnify:CR=1 FL=1
MGDGGEHGGYDGCVFARARKLDDADRNIAVESYLIEIGVCGDIPY